MAQNADNIAIVRPAVEGAAHSAPSTATLPTSATATMTGFSSLGWLSEDGISMSINKSTQDIKGFGGDIALTIQTEHSVEFKLKPLEFNVTVKKEIFGASNVDASGNVTITGDELDTRKWVFDMRGRNNELIRICVPAGKVTEIGEIPFKTGEPVASELTIDCFPDASGAKAYIYVGTATASA